MPIDQLIFMISWNELDNKTIPGLPERLKIQLITYIVKLSNCEWCSIANGEQLLKIFVII